MLKLLENDTKILNFSGSKVSAVIDGPTNRIVYWNPIISFNISGYNYKWWDTGVDAYLNVAMSPYPPFPVRFQRIEMNMNRGWGNSSTTYTEYDPKATRTDPEQFKFSYFGSRVNLGMFFTIQYKDAKTGEWTDFKELNGNFAFGYSGDNGKATSFTNTYKGTIAKEVYDDRGGFKTFTYTDRIFMEQPGKPSA